MGREDRRFSLRSTPPQFQAEGNTESFAPALIEVHTDDLLVDPRLLSRWLPLDFQLDVSTLVLDIVPSEVLPLQERWARAARSQELGRVPAISLFPQFELEPHPYELWSWPVVDISSSMRLARGGDSGITRKTEALRAGGQGGCKTRLRVKQGFHPGGVEVDGGFARAKPRRGGGAGRDAQRRVE